MGPEGSRDIDHSTDFLEVAMSRIEGYFLGKIDEFGIEIDGVGLGHGPNEVNHSNGHRRSQETEMLERCRRELQNTMDFLMGTKLETADAIHNRSEGYFDAKFEEFDIEMEDVELSWKFLHIKGSIKRKDRQLALLKRAKLEMERAKNYVNRALGYAPANPPIEE